MLCYCENYTKLQNAVLTFTAKCGIIALVSIGVLFFGAVTSVAALFIFKKERGC